MSRLPLHALQSFLYAARLGNLSRAAERLHLTVSALSHQIRGLEERLDRRLFDRGPRGIRLTGDGQQLFDAIADAFGQIEHALRPRSAGRDDVLTLSLLPSLASSWLVPRLGSFLASNPQIEINLQSSVALVDFERDSTVDAALRYGPGHWPGVEATHLFDDWITPLASPQLLARLDTRTELSDEELAKLPLLGDQTNRWRDWFTSAGVRAPKRFLATLDDAETLHRAAVSGLGVAMGRLTLARPLIEAGLLVELSPRRMKSDFAHYLVHLPRSNGHRGLQAFRAWLLEQAQKYDAGTAPSATAAPRPSARKRRR